MCHKYLPTLVYTFVGKVFVKVKHVVQNSPILLFLDMSNSLGELISHIKYEQNLCIFEILCIDNFAICKIQCPIFLYIHIQCLIYLKNGPKFLGSDGHWDPFLTGTSNFKSSLCECVWA